MSFSYVKEWSFRVQLAVRISGQTVLINSAKVTTANVNASNGVVHIIDGVLLPAPALPFKPQKGTNHLWFRHLTGNVQGGGTCGDVDAGPRMPDSIFEPSNAAALKAYEAATIALFLGKQENIRLELGRCADKNYTVPDVRCSCDPKKIQPPFVNECPTVIWAPDRITPSFGSVMDQVCQERCKCDYMNNNKTAAARKLPECGDQPAPGAPSKFCSLCGPTYNSNACISLYTCKQRNKYDCGKPNKLSLGGAGVLAAEAVLAEVLRKF